ncbi:MAG: hypothetical protein EOP06_02355 [Proteobacteria bacterium]|nr:MAG: hypothetical protein EOP06_02355 [Pseudomonadota bacterium]
MDDVSYWMLLARIETLAFEVQRLKEFTGLDEDLERPTEEEFAAMLAETDSLSLANQVSLNLLGDESDG